MEKEVIFLKVCKGTKLKIREKMKELSINTITQYIIGIIKKDLEGEK